MKRKRLLMVSVCLALIVAVMPFLAACPAPTPAPPPVVPPSAQPLKYGMSICVTGVAAEKGSPMARGKLDAIEYINRELGGVNGHPIDAIWYDNSYDAAKAAIIVKRLMAEGALFFTTNSSKMMAASMEIANRAEFPGIASFSSPVVTHPPKHTYAQSPDYGDDAYAFFDYYMENIWEGTGKPKVALHLLNNPTGYGARDALRIKADELGIEVIATEEHTAATISEMESMTRIKALNPDVLFISSTPAPTAVIIRNAYELGMYPGIVIGTAHASFTKALVDIAGADIVEGVYGTFPTVEWGKDVPGMAKMTEYAKKLSLKYYGNMDYIVSWAEVLIGAEILRLTLEAVGYDVLAKGDVESWRAIEKHGFQKLDYDVEGLHGPVKYREGLNTLSVNNMIYQIQNGELVSISDWITTPVIKYEEYEWWGK